MIELKNIQKIYQKKLVLDVDKLVFETGDIVGLIGKNGAGKTTLAEIILGTNDQTKGAIIYDPSFKSLRRNAVFQESSFDSVLNLKQNVKFYHLSLLVFRAILHIFHKERQAMINDKIVKVKLHPSISTSFSSLSFLHSFLTF